MPKKAAIVKSCPKCDLNVAVASKTCKCGHSFFQAKRTSSRTSSAAYVSVKKKTNICCLYQNSTANVKFMNNSLEATLEL